MTTLKLAVLDGDGIGPEVTEEALKVLDVLAHETDFSFEYERADFGGAAIDSSGNPFPDSCERLVKASDAVLLGAVGGPKWDALTGNQRPERGLLNLRGSLGVYANLRPARFFDSLCSASPLRADLTADVDFVTVRELIGGIYFGEPRGITEGPDGRVGQNTMIYSESEILRIGRVAFETAMGRKKKLLSVDKANVLEVQRLWREVMTELGKEYPEVELTHMYVDNCAMQMVTNPAQFDVLVTGNIFGDILSDASAALTGSLGMLPSASLGDGPGLFEPVHGTAPDIAGQGKANPLATILSVSMLLKHAAKRPDLSSLVDDAVDAVLAQGLRTGDIATGEGHERMVGTEEMGGEVVHQIKTLTSSRKECA